MGGRGSRQREAENMRFMASRIIRYALTVFCIATLHFFLIHLMPGDPIIHLLGEETYGHLLVQNPQALQEIESRYGLDRPLILRYFTSVESLAKGDLGWSYQYGQPVLKVLLYRLQWTAVLLLPSLFLSALLGAFLGSLAGWSKRRWLDKVFTPLLLGLYAFPVYCLALVLLLILAFWAKMVPLGGMAGPFWSESSGFTDRLSYMLLPMMVIVLHGTGYYALIMRNAVRQARTQPHVINAMARGLRGPRLFLRHVGINALPPYIAVLALHLGFLVGGALLVEVVFSWQGMGTLMYEAVASRDYPLLSGSFLLLATCVVLANALADLLYALLDPRVRDGLSST